MNYQNKLATISETKSEVLLKIKNLSAGRYTFFSNGCISSLDVLIALLLKLPPQPMKVMIATWQLGIKDAGEIHKLLVKYPEMELKILLDVSYENRNPNYYKRVKSLIGDIIYLSVNHTKIMTIACGDLHYAVLSSANFNRNFRFEFFDINLNKELYDLITSNYCHFFEGKPITGKEYNRSDINKEFASRFEKQSVDNNHELEMIYPYDLDFDLGDIL